MTFANVQTKSLRTFLPVNKIFDLAVAVCRQIVSSITKYFYHGPPLPSWSLTSTLLFDVIRTSIQAVDDQPIEVRRALSSTSMPAGRATVKPHAVPVVPRGLEGVLKGLEEREIASGSRRTIAADWITPRRDGVEKDDREGNVCLYFHGGAYCLMSAGSHRNLVSRIAQATDSRALSINYRLAPEHPFPAALHDAVHTFLYMIDKENGLGLEPKSICLAGDSAGGGLCMATMMYLRDHDLPAPAAAILISPWVDLTCSSSAYKRNIEHDILPELFTFDDPRNMVRMYCGGGPDGTLLNDELLEAIRKNPYVSPLHAEDLTNLPPMLIQGGDAELLADDIILLGKRLANVAKEKDDIHLHMYPDMVHVFQIVPSLSETVSAVTEIGNFVRQKLPVAGGASVVPAAEPASVMEAVNGALIAAEEGLVI